jgi:hypothetical protein
MDPTRSPDPGLRWPGLRWGVEHRQRFIEARLFFDGRVNRSDLVAAFGISVPQASADLALYQRTAPANIVYDPRAKAYLAGPDLRPVHGEPDPAAFLARALAGGAAGVAADAAPQPVRLLPAAAVRAVASALRGRRALPVRYQSIGERPPEWRRITPGAFATDGTRWHVRAWCHTRLQHRDFLLPRMLEFAAPEETPSPPPDEDWLRRISLRLVPAARLSAESRAIVARDYGMTDGVLDMPVRVAMLPYAWRRLNLARGDGLTELANRAEIEAELARMGWRHDEG